ncbi:MAG: HIT family protein, partial [Acetivibrio ethanolgignens]
MVATVLQDILHCDGLNVLQNNGEAAGQSVFHLHVHLIPRYENDRINIQWAPGTPDDTFLSEFADRVSTALGQSRA